MRATVRRGRRRPDRRALVGVVGTAVTPSPASDNCGASSAGYVARRQTPLPRRRPSASTSALTSPDARVRRSAARRVVVPRRGVIGDRLIGARGSSLGRARPPCHRPPRRRRHLWRPRCRRRRTACCGSRRDLVVAGTGGQQQPPSRGRPRRSRRAGRSTCPVAAAGAVLAVRCARVKLAPALRLGWRSAPLNGLAYGAVGYRSCAGGSPAPGRLLLAGLGRFGLRALGLLARHARLVLGARSRRVHRRYRRPSPRHRRRRRPRPPSGSFRPGHGLTSRDIRRNSLRSGKPSKFSTVRIRGSSPGCPSNVIPNMS